MLNKDERTIAVYMKAGALMRLYKTIGAKLFDAAPYFRLTYTAIRLMIGVLGSRICGRRAGSNPCAYDGVQRAGKARAQSIFQTGY